MVGFVPGIVGLKRQSGGLSTWLNIIWAEKLYCICQLRFAEYKFIAQSVGFL